MDLVHINGLHVQRCSQSWWWVSQWVLDRGAIIIYKERKLCRGLWRHVPGEARGGLLGIENTTVTFLRPFAPKTSAMHCVALNKIDLSYMVYGRLFSTLFHITPSATWPCPFRFARICRKKRVFPTIFPGAGLQKLCWHIFYQITARSREHETRNGHRNYGL